MTTLFSWVNSTLSNLWSKMSTMMVYTNLDLANLIFISIIIFIILYLFRKLVINGK